LRKMVVLAVVVAIVLAAAAPALAHSESAHDSGKLFGIGGGRQMYMECQGEGSPTVVFVSGGGDRAETWSKTLDSSKQAVLPAIAETNRVCAYDRPGTILATGEGAEDFEPSRSDPVPQPRTLQDGARDLHALLNASGEQGPYVVVGHSLGGAIARHYASEYPQDVSGLVLVDYTPYELRYGLTAEERHLWLTTPVSGNPPEEALTLYPALERYAHRRNFKQVLAAAPLEPMPLIVLSADKPYDLTPFVDDGSLPLTADQGEEFAKDLFRAVLDARTYLVSQVPGVRHITDTDSGHYIHQEQPQLVIGSVREVLDAVEQRSPSLLTNTGGVPPSVFLLASTLLLGTGVLVARWVVRVR